jgi:hypothetical protein
MTLEAFHPATPGPNLQITAPPSKMLLPFSKGDL